MNDYKNKSIKELKALARGRLIGKYSIAVLVVTTVLIIEILATMITNNGDSSTLYGYFIMVAISLVIDLLTGVLNYGESYFFLNLIRCKNDLKPTQVFYGLKNNTDKAILLELPLTLASLVGLIPSVIYTFMPQVFAGLNDYLLMLILTGFQLLMVFIVNLFLVLSNYILCDHPEYTVKEIFLKSMDLMKKKKGRFILIYLSLIPLFAISVLAFGVGIIWFSVYFKTIMAFFYLDCIEEEPVDQNKKESEVKPDDFSTLDIRL